MADRHWPLRTTRRHIIELLRREPLTISEVADRLELTASAVRIHMRALEEQGLVQRTGIARGLNRPAVIYGPAPGIDVLVSGAYLPFVSNLLRTMSEELPADDVATLMSRAGKRLAAIHDPPSGTLRQRAEAVSGLLNSLGALTEVEVAKGRLTVRGFDCPLAAAVQDNPTVCRVVESFVAELVRVPVRECCDRSGRPRCRFEIVPSARGRRPTQGSRR